MMSFISLQQQEAAAVMNANAFYPSRKKLFVFLVLGRRSKCIGLSSDTFARINKLILICLCRQVGY